MKTKRNDATFDTTFTKYFHTTLAQFKYFEGCQHSCVAKHYFNFTNPQRKEFLI